MKLLYTGASPVTFLTGMVGTVSPGEEFNVPDELVPAFLSRGDVEEIQVVVEEEVRPSPRKRRRNEEPGRLVATDGGNPEKMSEENGGVSSDH